MGRKRRTQADVDERIIRQIDSLVGRRKRSQFLERAAIAQLRLEALKAWEAFREKLKGRGVTLQDYYESRLERQRGRATVPLEAKSVMTENRRERRSEVLGPVKNSRS